MQHLNHKKNDKKTTFLFWGYSYGTANQAFDPHSELDDISHGSFQVNGATLKVTTSSEEEEEEDSVTPRQEHISRGVLKLKVR